MQAQGVKDPEAFHHHGAAGPVVDGAGSHVPGIQVAGQDDDFLRLLTAGNFRHHVGGLGHRFIPAAQIVFHDHLFSGGKQPLDQFGILGADRGGGDFWNFVVVPHHTGVGEAVIGGSQRPVQGADGALFRRFDGAGYPVLGRPAVTVADAAAVPENRRGVQDDLSFDLFAEGVEFFEVGHGDDLGPNAARRGGDAASQGGDRHRVLGRQDDPGGGVSTHPVRNHGRFRVYVRGAVFPEFVRRPFDRFLEVGGAGDAGADPIGEPGRRQEGLHSCPLAAKIRPASR